MKICSFILVGVVFLILITGGLFFYFVKAPSKPKVEVKNPIENLSQEEAVLEFNETYIDYLVYALGGWKLHKSVLSDDTPKIKVVVGDETFVSEIINGEIKTEKRDTDKEDIMIRTTKEEVVNTILAFDMEKYVKESVEEGRTTIELKASKTILFSKGYLAFYKDITGESFTGAIIKMFG